MNIFLFKIWFRLFIQKAAGNIKQLSLRSVFKRFIMFNRCSSVPMPTKSSNDSEWSLKPVNTLPTFGIVGRCDDVAAVDPAVGHGVRALPPAHLGRSRRFWERHAAVGVGGAVIRVPGGASAVGQWQNVRVPRQSQLTVSRPETEGSVVVLSRSGRHTVPDVAEHSHLGRRLVAAHLCHGALWRTHHSRLCVCAISEKWQTNIEFGVAYIIQPCLYSFTEISLKFWKTFLNNINFAAKNEKQLYKES